MSKLLIKLVKFAIIVGLFYALGSLIAWDFNPGHWQNRGRLLLTLICFGIGYDMFVPHKTK